MRITDADSYYGEVPISIIFWWTPRLTLTYPLLLTPYYLRFGANHPSECNLPPGQLQRTIVIPTNENVVACSDSK